MANRWVNNGNRDRLYFLGLQKSLWMVTTVVKLKDTCSLEEKLWQTYTVCLNRNITLLTKVHIVKAIVFPIVIYGCESWTIKKAENWRTDAFKMWCWRRLLRVLWTSRRSNKSILEEINPEYSLEGMMLKPKLQYFGHLMWRDNSLEKTLMLGKIEGKKRRRHQRIRWLDGHEFEQTLGDSEGQESLVCCTPWDHKE